MILAFLLLNSLSQSYDASEILDLLNTNSKYLNDSNFTVDKDLVQEYVRANESLAENGIKLPDQFNLSNFLTYKNPWIINFNP